MWTSTGDHCGIASYTASLMAGWRATGEVDLDVVNVPYDDRTEATRDRLLAQLNAADLVHIQHEYSFFGGILPGHSSLPAYLAGLRVPHVMTGHTTLAAHELLRADAELRLLRRIAKRALAAWPPWRDSVEASPYLEARRVIVHTREAAETFARRGVPAERLQVLPAGVPETVAPADLDSLCQRVGLPTDDKRWLTLFGFVKPEKGYDLILRGLLDLPDDAHLVVAGGARLPTEEPYVERLRSQIAAAGLADRVTITGFLSEAEIAAIMGNTTLALAPHTVASGSYSVMLPIAYGVPVLASDLACFRDLEEAEAGLEVFPTPDAGELRVALIRLLSDESSRNRLAGQAGEYAAQHTWEAVARRTLDIYREALTEGR